MEATFSEIFSVFDTVGITLEAFHNYVGTLPTTLQLNRISTTGGGGGSIHQNTPQREVYLAPEDIQKLSFALFASHE